MAQESSAMEKRLYALEILVQNLLNGLASTNQTAGQALQNSQIGSGFGGGSSGGSPSLIYTTSAGTARNGHTGGQATFQFVNGIGQPPVFTNTGDGGDQGLTGYNVTGGTTPLNAYGIAIQIEGNWYYIVIDCLSTTNPGPPANPSSTQVTQDFVVLETQAGDGLVYN